jgi:eukaryotic-like serine/threonine-protein kinase
LAGTLRPMKRASPWPHVLPGGTHMLFTAFDPRLGRLRGYVARLGDEGPGRALVESDSRVLYTGSLLHPGAGYLMYVRAGTLLAQPFDAAALRITGEAKPVVQRVYSFFAAGAADFSVSDSGTLAYLSYASRSQLAWVDRSGARIAPFGPADINVKSARLSPDGTKAAAAVFDVERGVNDIWIIDTSSGAARRTVAGPGMVDAASWSPDSKRLVYLRGFGAMPRLYVRGTGEKDAETALPAGGFQMPTDWSRDGRYIAYVNTGFARFGNEQQADVYVADLSRDGKTSPLLQTRFNEANAVFSPDGKWLAFTSDESGQTEVYLQAFQAGDTPQMVGERYLVSRNGALSLRWRADGRELFYLAYDGRVHAVPVTLGAKPSIGQATPLFGISTEARAAIHSIDGFDVSADGRRFLIPVVSAAAGPALVVVQNWEAALGRK